MSSLLHPVGPQPPRVYWRRRLAVVIGIVVVVALLATLLVVVLPKAMGGGEEEKAAPTPTSPASTTPASNTPVACTPEQLAVTVATDAPSYAEGAAPTFAVSIANSSATSCTLDAGEAAREVLVTSGSDRIWSSTDCPAEPASRLLLLAPGGKDAQAVPWSRIRSGEGCAQGLPAPRAGTYNVVVSVAGVTSAPAVFQLG